MTTINVCYFHGFASGPDSQKGVLIRDALAEYDVNYVNPDLNGDNFLNLTMDAWRARALAAIQSCDPSQPLLLCGSSLGAYTAVALLDELAEFSTLSLLLLAPAFAFVNNWAALVGDEGIAEWKRGGSLPFYHFMTEREEQLGYGFYRSCQGLPAYPVIPENSEADTRAVPIHIIHGRGDDVCPLDMITDYAAGHESMSVDIRDDDHALMAPSSQACIQSTARRLVGLLQA